MSDAQTVAGVAVVAFAAVVQAGTGFGFALVAAPALMALVSPAHAVGALAVVGVVVNAATLAGGRGRDVHRREAAGLLAWAVPGLPAGAVALTVLPGDAIRAAVGVVVLVAVALRLRGERGAVGIPAAGLLSGALTTATGTNGPPLVVRMTTIRAAPPVRRDTLAVVFLVLGVLGVAMLAAAGTLRLPAVTPLLALAGVAGIAAGRPLAGRLSSRADRWGVALLLVASGAGSIVAAIA